MKAVEDIHIEQYREKPAVTVSVPLVTTILGSFAEYCSGYALSSTIEEGMVITISERSDGIVEIFNSHTDERKKFPVINAGSKKDEKWCTMPRAVCQAVQSIGKGIGGFNMTISGAGLRADTTSTSASMAAGILAAVNELFSLKYNSTMLTRVGFSARLFAPPAYAPRLRDLITLFASSEGKILFFDTETMEYEFIDYPFTDGSGTVTWFIDCSLPDRELEEVIDEFSDCCVEAMKSFEVASPPGTKVRNLSETDILHMHLSMPENRKRAISYMVAEASFAVKSVEAIKSLNATALGKIFTAQQTNLFEMAEITSPEVDWLVRRGVGSRGVRGITEVATGIAGTLIAVIDEGYEDGYFAKTEDYEKIFGYTPKIKKFIPSGSISIV